MESIIIYDLFFWCMERLFIKLKRLQTVSASKKAKSISRKLTAYLNMANHCFITFEENLTKQNWLRVSAFWLDVNGFTYYTPSTVHKLTQHCSSDWQWNVNYGATLIQQFLVKF